jgi:hypothetical protein
MEHVSGGLDERFWALAEQFLEFVSRETSLPMIVCDGEGIIRKSVVKSRLGTPHAGAQRILRGEVDEAFVSAEEAAANPNVKEGYSCPIVVEGRRVGTFGITGPLALARPLTRVAAQVLAVWLNDLAQQRRLREVADHAVGAVRDFGSRVDRAAADSERAAGQMTRASQEAAQKVGSTDDVVRRVQDIAQQSRMLSINGSVEATRAGNHGRAFGVIAREMLDLAEDARRAAGEIQTQLAEVRVAVCAIETAGAAALTSGRGQVETLREVRQKVESLQAAIAALVGAPGHTARA